MGKKQIKLEKKVERKRRVRKKVLAKRAALRAEAKELREKELLEKAVIKADREAQLKAEMNPSPSLQKTLKILEDLKKR